MTLHDVQGPPAVGVAELQRAWAAVVHGEFRSARALAAVEAQPPVSTAPTAPAAPPEPRPSWTPQTGEAVIPVLGCHGHCGATTLAVAIATGAAPARVVECASHTASGLLGACDAELGIDEHDWAAGTREGGIRLERPWDVFPSADLLQPPAPRQGNCGVTVVDAAWEIGQLLATPCWLSDVLNAAPMTVLVTTATVPGMRRLQAAAGLLGQDRVLAAVIGPRRKRWPRGAARETGQLIDTLVAGRRLVEVPREDSLAAEGLTSAPLPAPLLRAAEQLLRRLAED